MKLNMRVFSAIAMIFGVTLHMLPSSYLGQHGQVQEQFQQIRQNLGLPRLKAAEMAIIRWNRQPQKSQELLNVQRVKLNSILDQPELTEDLKNEFETQLKIFKEYNPARRPSPADYEEMYRVKLEKQEKSEKRARAEGEIG